MSVKILHGDCREVIKTLPEKSVHCCITSPPYFGLRDYGVAGQIGLEISPQEFVAEMVTLFREVRRVLRDDGTLWFNMGDCYFAGGRGGAAGSKQATNEGALLGAKKVAGYGPKQLLGIPWRCAFALQDDGWILRQEIIWSKPNPMPESVTDRCTRAHENIFMFSKSLKYYYNANAIAEPAIYSGLTGQDESGFKDAKKFSGKYGKTDKQRGHSRRHAGFNARWDSMSKEEQCSGTRNKRSVWEVPTRPFAEAHFATFPPDLIEPCVKSGCPAGGVILDPFGGAGTTGLVADRNGRDAILIELNPAYAEIAEKRIMQDGGMFSEVVSQ